MSAPRMRTLDSAIAQLKADDPESGLTKYALRQMVLSGVVPSVKAGAKYLINYDALLDMLAVGFAQTEPEAPAVQPGTIRPIELKVMRGR